MNGLYNRIRNFALRNTKEESAISFFMGFLYRLFTNEIVDAVMNILGTVAISIMTGVGYYGIFFFICVILYSLSLLLMACAKRYQREKLIENRILKQALFGVNGTLREWAIELQKSAKLVLNLKKRSLDAMRRSVASINFQSAAFVVCVNLRNNLTKYYDNDNIYITIFQKQVTDEGMFCKMIAYSEEHEPSTYGEPYYIPEYREDLLGNIEYHSYLFSVNKTDIAVLPDHKSVEKSFVPHQKSAEREEEIQQYIGIPIAPAKLGVTFILQVDTNIPYLFGKDKHTVTLLAKTAIYPFAQFLHMIYEQSRTIEQLIGGDN